MKLLQVFPTDAVSLATVADLKGDLVAWSVAIIGVVLVVFAYRKISKLFDPVTRLDDSPGPGERYDSWTRRIGR